jgi:hypothetical protein
MAVAATDNPKIVAPVNQTDNVVFLPFNDVQALEQCFQQHGDQIAAVIVEGIQGVGGIHVATDQFLQHIRQLTTAYGALYIADSVQCGYGRSGRFFAHDYAGVEADVYTTAKGMANSFAEWMNHLDVDFTITCPEGYTLHPAYTGRATIEYNQQKALEGADFVYVKNWSSYADYGKVLCTDPSWMLTQQHLEHTNAARVMHCLPVRRNVELSDEILDGSHSLVLKQAENRVFAAQTILKRMLENT